MQTELYFLRSSEQYLAKELLYYAMSLEQSDKNLQDYPKLEQYERNYGTYGGDIGVYMMADGKVAGGAWVRILANGFGYVDQDTPELILTVKPEYRNKGIAKAVMHQLFIEVSKIFSQISMSVSDTNPAISFYEDLGFKKLEGSKHTSPIGRPSFVMLKRLEKPEQEQEIKHLEEECFRKSFRQDL